MNEQDPPIEGDVDLQLIEALGIVDPPTTAVSDGHLTDLREAMTARAEGHHPIAARSFRGRRGRIATGVIGIAAALLVVTAIDVRPTNSNRADATTLQRLATKAGQAPLVDPERPILHITYRFWANDDGGDIPELAASKRPPDHLDAWRRADGSGVERSTAYRPGQDEVIAASDPGGSQYVWNEGRRSCPLRRAGDAGVRTTLQGRRFDAEVLASLPTEPEELRSALEDFLTTNPARPHTKRSPDPASTPSKETRDRARSCEARPFPTNFSDEEVEMYVDGAVRNLLAPWASPELRKAAFSLLADRDDVTVGKGSDPLGRKAVTIVEDIQGDRYTTYIDPTTTEFLGTVGRDGGGELEFEEVVERSEWVAKVPTS